MKTRIIFLTMLFFVFTNVVGQESIDFTKRNEQTSFSKNMFYNPARFIKHEKFNSLYFNDNVIKLNIQTKSTNALKQKLDSIIGTDDTFKSIFHYDTDGKNIQQNNYSRDEINNQWLNNGKYEYIYNVNDYLSINTYYDWDNENNQWINESKFEYAYDANGNLTSKIGFEWDSENNQWGNSYKMEYNYDSNANPTFELYYEWSTANNIWILYNKYENNYDGEGNVTLRVYYDWNSSSSQWDAYAKKEYSYDINGNLMQYISYDWSSSTNQWVESNKYEYSYDEYGNMMVSIRYYIDDITGQWRNSLKKEYAYDSNNNNTQVVSFSWNSTDNVWESNWKNESLYNTSYAFSDLILPIMNDEPWQNWNNMLTEINHYDWNNEQWEFNITEILCYSELTITGIDEVKNTFLSVYPNPTSTFIVIQPLSSNYSSIFELYDMKGTKVLSREFSYKTQVSTNELQSGIYFYHIISKGERINGKLIKE